MTALLTEKEFSKHVNTKFRVKVDSPSPIELELVEVKPYANKDEASEQGGMERFSVFFSGPSDIFIQQGIYPLSHEQMGEFELFIVPLARNENGFRYEAVFNYKT